MFDVLLTNAKIVDGANTPWYMGDVGITGDRITAIGKLTGKEAKETIDLQGRVLAPGFIDVHTHFDLLPFPFNESKYRTSDHRTRQGLTTVVVGCCGISASPMSPERSVQWMEESQSVKDFPEDKWLLFSDYLNDMSHQKLSTNFAAYVGHGALRYSVMGNEAREPSEEELEKMKERLRESMDAGALGMSTGLIYQPGIHAKTEELIALTEVLKDTGGVYVSHIRSEASHWIEAIQEVIDISETNKIPGIIHHLKTKSNNAHETVPQVLSMIEEARDRGVDIVFDQYPYQASATTMSVTLPLWARSGDPEDILERIRRPENRQKLKDGIREDYGWKTMEDEKAGTENFLILSAKNHPEYIGKTVRELAEERGIEPSDMIIELLINTELSSGAAFFGIQEEGILAIMQNPYGMIGSDSGDAKVGGMTHPRTNGTFAKVIGEYVLEKKVLSLEEGIYKMTGLPATKLGLTRRGMIKEGFFADLVVFDPNIFRDCSSYLEPDLPAVGMTEVFLNGKQILGKDPEETFHGRVLRRGVEG
jgi:N-acyl-D-amino-acid deacylase